MHLLEDGIIFWKKSYLASFYKDNKEYAQEIVSNELINFQKVKDSYSRFLGDSSYIVNKLSTS